MADWIGRRLTFAICIALSFVAITLEFVAVDIEVFFGGKIINGFATGALASVCTTYIGEIAPLALRGILTVSDILSSMLVSMSNIQTQCLIALAYTVGPFTVALIVNSTGNQSTRWSYRAVFCSQYGFAVIAAALWWFMPGKLRFLKRPYSF